MSQKYRFLVSLSVAGLVALSGLNVLFVSPAAAQDDDPAQETPFDRGMDLDQFEDGAMVITGSEYLPNFQVFIEREDLSRAFDLELDEALLPKIVDAIELEPF